MQGMIPTAGKAKPGAAPIPQGAQAPEQQAGAYEQGMNIVREALYGKEAARDVAQALKVSNNPSEALSTTAYEMVTIADEATQGAIPDEELIAFASEVLGEVADIAIAAGIEVKGATIAKAMQLMLVRYVTEQGMDPTQLQQAMAQVNPDELGAELDKVA